jgi:hypothetical protein
MAQLLRIEHGIGEVSTVGRQINFWMTEADEYAFLDRLRRDDVVWSPYALPLGARPVVHELDEWQPTDDRQWRVLIRRAEWSKLLVQDIAGNPLPEFRPDGFKPWTMVGALSSPAFQWSTCARGPGLIKRGRIYYSTDYFDADSVPKVQFKEPEPTKWFDRLTGWLRRRGRKHNYKGQYIMPDAATQLDAGHLEIRF